MTFTAHVITVSTRGAAGIWEDRSGPVLVAGLHELGLIVTGPEVIPDGEQVETSLRTAIAGHTDLVLTTGGTGLTPTDQTPEYTARVIERDVPGLADLIREVGRAKGVATSVLSRGIAGIADGTLIINVPGSPGGAKDAVEALAPILIHALEQIKGSDHPRA